MPIQPTDGKTAVATFVDGLELKFVRVSAKGNAVTLRDFKTVMLVKKLEERGPGAGKDEGSFEASGAESFAAGGVGLEAPGEETNNNPTVLLGLLSDIGSPRKYSFSYALTEPAITYQEFENDFGMKGDKLRKKIVQELAETRATVPQSDAVDYVPKANGGILSVIREDGLHVFDLLNEIRTFLGGRTPNTKIIHSADLALVEMVRLGYEVQQEEVTVIVYVGHDFSRLIFMQGNEYLHFAPIISEGFESPNIENTIYSRILLEQDNIALTRIDRILLAGESHKVNLLESIGPQFAAAQVEYIKLPSLDLLPFDGNVGEAVSEYAIPIMTAIKALGVKVRGQYDLNMVPLFIVEGQKAFKLAWHGWVAALFTIGAIVFFYTSILSRNQEILRARFEYSQKQAKLTELDVFRQRREQLQGDITRYSNATSVYDSIAPGGDRWSRILHYLANSVEDLNSVWITTLKPDQSNPRAILITGRSVYRGRVERIAGIFERATLKEVRTVEIRKKVLYEFDILVEQVDKYDVPETLSGSGKR